MADESTAIQKTKNPVQLFSEFLIGKTAELAKVAPRTLTPERVVRVAVAAYSRTPDLQECTTLSVYNCIHQAVQLGFEPGSALKHCYMVPFRNKKTGKRECQLIISYPGLIDLARRTGTLQSVEAHVVHEKDHVELEFGLDPKFVHKPFLDGPPGAAKFFYALYRLKDGARHLEVMTKPEVDAIRTRSQASSSGPWVTDYEEMGKKTVLKRGFKVIPMSIEVAEAIEADNLAEPIDVTPLPAERPAAGARVVASIQGSDDVPELSTGTTEPVVPVDEPARAATVVLERVGAPNDAKAPAPAGAPHESKAEPSAAALLLEQVTGCSSPEELGLLRGAFAKARDAGRLDEKQAKAVEKALAAADKRIGLGRQPGDD